jgi:hypothetical protein
MLCLIAVLFLAAAARADETPETLLIRQALDNDKFGQRRGDAELVLSAFGDEVVVYAGNGTADPRGWTVLHEEWPAYAAAVTADLQARRYDIERSVPLLQVRGLVALVATVDSGKVVDRVSGAAQPYRAKRLWSFTKQEDENKWLATAVFAEVGDSLSAVPAAGGVDAGIAQVLQREAEGWREHDADAIAEVYGQGFVGYDGTRQFKPETWLIIFGNPEELKKWAEKRLRYTTYQVDRQVIYTTVGSGAREALALTLEQIATTYAKGPVRHDLARYVLWTLSQRSGSWKVTSMLCDLGLPQ